MSNNGSNGIQIYINEDSGLRAWKWTPKLTEQEFLGWFQDLTDSDIIKYYFNIRSLPGKLVPWRQDSKGGTILPRAYGDPKNFRPFYYMHFHDVSDTFISIGANIWRRSPTMKYDWKSHWADYWTKTLPNDY